MSDFQHRAMHHDGLYSTAAIHADHHHHQHHHAMHPPQTQPPMMDHCVTTCPYEEKIIQNGAVARMVLMFIRELVEHSSHQPRQSYACPMTRCHRPFPGPLQLIQHLLSCSEVSTGEFTCDKCNHWHTFPTSDKEWEQWAAVKTQQASGNEQGQVRRKRSLGSKIKGFATLTKRDPRKQNPAPDIHFKTEYSMDSRPSTAASSTPSTTFTSRCSEHHLHYQTHGHGNPTAFSTHHKPPLLPAGVPAIDGNGLFWPGFSADQLGNMPSSVPSVTPSSTLDTGSSKAISQNTSQTTLFTPSLNGFPPPVASVQVPTTMEQQQQYMFGTHASFNGIPSPVSAQPPPSAMVLDEPINMNGADLTPTELRSPVSNESLNHGWWGNKLGIETARAVPTTTGSGTCFQMQSPIGAIDGMMTRDVTSGLTTPTSPCRHASPFFPIPQSSAHPMSRALSHESMQAGMTPVYNSPGTNASHVDSLSPQTDHDPHSLSLRTPFEPAPEDLVCDECQWKPRGVRENLKGYLRKHKNTHKGLRLSCDVVGCTKTFSRLDNLKKHKKDKHGIEDSATGATCTQPPPKQMVEEFHGQHHHVEDEAEHKRPGTVDSEVRDMSGDYSMLWPALHF
ncbi:hypothetical protein QC764_116500 [Podospora pseudoanserina]|uniref:C2H2-type domain-containing protein n=1 Tax=Podospora pseudoanserina TaxID=2609844 RepID=A0ABR0IQK3_9PEZI|nr:hypothetical protein QC764_116500 [Podospora pseudoanserina]